MGINKIRRTAYRRLIAAFLGAGLVTAALSACGSQSSKETGTASAYADVTPEYVLTYAENQTDDYPTTQGARYFANLVQEATKGRIQIRIYADAQLGDEVSTLSQCQFGGIDFVRISLATATDYSDEANTLIMPYLYKDSNHMWKVLDGPVGEEVMDSFQGTGLVPLSWYDAGVRSFYFRDKVETMEDLEGKSIRVQPSNLMKDLVTSLGAKPVPVNYEDVYSALQKGTVDGAENNWSSYEAMDHDHVAPYFMMDEHIRIPEMQMISEATLKKLTPEEQQIIRDCARKSATYERKLWKEREEVARSRVEKDGCIVITLDEKEKQKFKEAVQPLYEKYCGDYMDVIARIEELEKEN